MKIELKRTMPARTQSEYGLNSFSVGSLFFARQRNAMSFTTNYDPVTANFNLCSTTHTARSHTPNRWSARIFCARFYFALCFYPTIFNYANIHPLYLNYHFSLSFCELLNRSLHFVSSTIFALFLFIFSLSLRLFHIRSSLLFFSMLVLLAR